MRKINSLMALAAVFSLASCQQDKLIDGSAVNGDGTLVDATFSVSFGPQTKAFADGNTVDKLYAGIYEIGANGGFTWVTDNSAAPAAISSRSSSVTFNGKLERGKSYRVVFWAQKAGAPYSIQWATTSTTGPSVTMAPTGAANDESRDAFYGSYDTGVVTSSIDLTGTPVTLKRPFSQVNVLVLNTDIDNASAAVTSSMTVAQAPTVLNLATKATGTPADWTFSTAAITESAFGNYANTHKYVAMNYVLVDQTSTTARYDVSFSVTAGTQTAEDKTVANIPLKANGRSNIVGNIFDENFSITIPVTIDPGNNTEEVMTTVTVAVGQTEAEAFVLTPNTTSSVDFAINHTIETEKEKPEITVEPATVATAEWNLSTGKLDITPLVENGSAVITLVFPSVTRAVYLAATVDVYVKVGNGQNTTPTPALSATPASTTVSAATTSVTWSITSNTDWTITPGPGVTPSVASGSGNAEVTLSFAANESTNAATYTATVSATGCQDVSITITQDGKGSVVTDPDFKTVAELKALLGAESATFTGTLTDAVVSFIASTSDAVIKDATGSILYHKETGHGLLQGQTITGDVIAEAVIYNGINEITDLVATVEGEGSAVEPEVVTLAQLAANYNKYESAYVKVVGVTSQTTTKVKGNITGRQGNTDYIIYTNVAIPVNEGDIFTAEGTVTKYNTTEELKVWRAADLTVTKPAPILSASPATTTVSAAKTSVTWSITSNTDWTITPGTGVTPSVTSGNGNADVTLSFAANNSSNDATYTATVSATGCEDVTITITQKGKGSTSTVTDELTASLFTATNTTYADFSNVAATSSARYAGNSAKDSSDGIMFRSKNSNSGIVSITSGGRVHSVVITYESGSNTIDIYGSHNAYGAATDLYGDNQGTLIGSLSGTGTVEFTDDYEYVGIRSNSGAVYITKIEIVWEQ